VEVGARVWPPHPRVNPRCAGARPPQRREARCASPQSNPCWHDHHAHNDRGEHVLSCRHEPRDGGPADGQAQHLPHTVGALATRASDARARACVCVCVVATLTCQRAGMRSRHGTPACTLALPLLMIALPCRSLHRAHTTQQRAHQHGWRQHRQCRAPGGGHAPGHTGLRLSSAG
jgi:hypothetical protein